MSQSKVEQKKYEKKHRQEILKKQKRKKFWAKLAAIVIVVAIVGSIAGVKIYNAIPKYVKADELQSFIDETWDDNDYSSLFTATDTDAEGDTSDDTEAADDTEADAADDAETSEE